MLAAHFDRSELHCYLEVRCCNELLHLQCYILTPHLTRKLYELFSLFCQTASTTDRKLLLNECVIGMELTFHYGVYI